MWKVKTNNNSLVRLQTTGLAEETIVIEKQEEDGFLLSSKAISVEKTAYLLKKFAHLSKALFYNSVSE